MQAVNLTLTTWRNHATWSGEFDPGVTYLIGENGVGKTAVLEALYLLTTTKSFRTSDLGVVIYSGETVARLELEYVDDQEERHLAAAGLEVGERRRKVFSLDNKEVPAKRFLGSFVSVMFTPEDLNLLILTPSLRRRYFDRLLCIADLEYAESLIIYQKALANRNKLLTEIRQGAADPADLDYWDGELIRTGELIMASRTALVSGLEGELSGYYQRLFEEGELRMEYLRSVSSSYAEEMASRREIDIAAGVTTRGSHRDDYRFILSGSDISTRGSRGQMRSAILALKLCEGIYLRQKLGQQPVYLLDDLFSELDQRRSERMIELLEGAQAIITTTEGGRGGREIEM